METPEARAKSAELHQRLLEEQRLKNPSMEGEDEDDEDEGDADENEDLSSGEEEIQVGGEKDVIRDANKFSPSNVSIRCCDTSPNPKRMMTMGQRRVR